MDFLPDSATLLAYSIASVILFITPGPDMSSLVMMSRINPSVEASLRAGRQTETVRPPLA